MSGGDGTETVYRCSVCGSEVKHSTDKMDFPDFWIVRPAKL
jgi:hypothetical protein